MSPIRNILAIVGVVLFLWGLYKTTYGFDGEKIQGASLLLAGAILIVGVLISASIAEKRDKSE
jgi:uncharacterized membrane protein